MATACLHLLCGKMASGKSTLAAALAREPGVLLLSEDQWLATLFPAQIHDVASYVRHSDRLKSALRDSLMQMLEIGVTLVLDFPANTRQQRQWLIGLAGAHKDAVQLHYLDCSDALCLQGLAQRASEQPERQQTDTVAMFTAMTRHFEAPSPEEGVNLIVHPQESC